MPAASSGPTGVSATGWGWRYATRMRWALREVDLRIDPGERVLLLGASGAGKSTFLHALAGVLGGSDEGEHAGSLLLDGAAPERRRGRAGLVLQDPDAQAVLSRVGDDVAFACENLGVPRAEIWARVREALDAVGLDLSLDRDTRALSGGQKQRLALAGALAMRPGLLLLDEPTANLDPAGVTEVRDAVAEAVQRTGATLIVVEHRTEPWLPLVDRVIVLADGERGGVLADGPVTEVLHERGPELAASGVWVPGIDPPYPPAPHDPGGVLVRAEALTVARVPGSAVSGPHDVAFRAGEVVGITGANGAGKSTLGLTVAGLLRAESGRVRALPALAGAAGPDPFTWTSRQLLTRIGTVLQDPEHQLLATSVRDELSIGPRALRVPEETIARRVDDLLDRLRLARLADANPYTLSGGEKRRLTVAAMLATAPRVCVLDEPTFGQDATTWAELVAIIAELRDDGAAVAAITHDAAVLRALHARAYRVEPVAAADGPHGGGR